MFLRKWSINGSMLLTCLFGGLAWSAQYEGAENDWSNTGGSVSESGYSQLSEIRAENVHQLGLAWSIDLGGEQTLEATPLAVAGTLYFTGSTSVVYAVNGLTGELKWRYDPEVWKHNPEKMRYTFPVNRGAAYARGSVFVCTLDGRLIALSAVDGRLLWSVDTVPSGSKHSSTGAPRVFNDKVIIGNGGADYSERGYVTAYEQITGRQVWRFYVTPGSPEENKGNKALETAAKTWGKGEYWKSGTGGTVWNAITFDPEFNHIYLGTGNGGPWSPQVRDPGGGDDLYLASIVALDADTGAYIWHYQMNPREGWDYKATANIIETTLTIGGRPRKVLLQAPTNGFFYVIDRETGKLMSAEKIGKVTWADHIDLKTGRPVETPNIRYEKGETIMYPSMLGAHNWQAMSFNPKTGLVYIPSMQLGARYATKATAEEYFFAGLTVGTVKSDETDGKGALLAWDPISQKLRWRVEQNLMWNGGTLTTDGNLVFQGAADGHFSAYDATGGTRLWSFNAGLGIIGAPISYAIDGRQYIAVLVGYGGAASSAPDVMNAGWKFGAQPRRLLSFRLNGIASLPTGQAPDFAVHALDDPSLKIDREQAQRGHGLWINCIACHGPQLRSAGSPGPDLRESRIALDPKSLSAILHDGTMMPLGMPRFENFTEEQVAQLFAYIRLTAREAAADAQPSKLSPRQ